MKVQEDLDHTIEQVFERGGESLPEDRYFKKIWNSIETRAPVGEKYYLRWIFSAFFILLFIGVIALFYSDFLSSVLTLKEIRRENSAFFTGEQPGRDFKREELLPGVVLTSREKVSIKLARQGPDGIEFDFFKGHGLIEKGPEVLPVIIRLPGMTLTLRQGKLNLFCYDGIIRVIPVADPVEIELKGERQVIQPGKTFYLLDGHPTKR